MRAAPESPKALDAAIRRALAATPSERFSTAAAFAEAIERIGGTAAEGRWKLQGQSRPPSIAPAIAVLPFVNLSADQGNDYFSEGMTEELIHALARIPQAASRLTDRRCSTSRREISTSGGSAKKLAVMSVLEGTVRRAGKQTAHQCSVGGHTGPDTISGPRCTIVSWRMCSPSRTRSPAPSSPGSSVSLGGRDDLSGQATNRRAWEVYFISGAVISGLGRAKRLCSRRWNTSSAR